MECLIKAETLPSTKVCLCFPKSIMKVVKMAIIYMFSLGDDKDDHPILPVLLVASSHIWIFAFCKETLNNAELKNVAQQYLWCLQESSKSKAIFAFCITISYLVFQNAVKCLFWREVLGPWAVDIFSVFALGKYSLANITNTVGNHFSLLSTLWRTKVSEYILRQ